MPSFFTLSSLRADENSAKMNSMSQPNIQQLTEVIREKSQFVDVLFQEVGKVVVGQNTLIEKLVLALLCDGHVLLEGLPGLAKLSR